MGEYGIGLCRWIGLLREGWTQMSMPLLNGLFAFEGVGVLGGDSACRGRVGVEVFR